MRPGREAEAAEGFRDANGQCDVRYTVGADEAADDQWIDQSTQLPGAQRCGQADAVRQHLPCMLPVKVQTERNPRADAGGDQGEKLPGDLAHHGSPHSTVEPGESGGDQQSERLARQFDARDPAEFETALEPCHGDARQSGHGNRGQQSKVRGNKFPAAVPADKEWRDRGGQQSQPDGSAQNECGGGAVEAGIGGFGADQISVNAAAGDDGEKGNDANRGHEQTIGVRTNPPGHDQHVAYADDYAEAVARRQVRGTAPGFATEWAGSASCGCDKSSRGGDGVR